MGKRQLWAAAWVGVVLWAGVARAAQPSQDEVLKSISSSVDHGESISGRSMTAIGAAVGGVILVAVVINHRQARRAAANGGYTTAGPAAAPGPVNHPGRLVRELMRETGLTKAQVRQLETANGRLADDGKSVDHLLTLLLCPSLLTAAKEALPPVDR